MTAQLLLGFQAIEVVVCMCVRAPVRAKLFLAVSQLLSALPTCVSACSRVIHFSALLVFEDVCGGVPASLLTTICFSSVRKRIPRRPCSHQRGLRTSP